MSEQLQLEMESDIGPLFLVASDKGLQVIFWTEQKAPWVTDSTRRSPAATILEKTRKQLQEYFRGERRSFDVPLDPQGTEFQKKVWQKLAQIPYGAKTTYKAIAMELGTPSASRAVGTANAKNPLSIIVPCHRVIASSGALAGYSGGLEIKSSLLNLEQSRNA